MIYLHICMLHTFNLWFCNLTKPINTYGIKKLEAQTHIMHYTKPFVFSLNDKKNLPLSCSLLFSSSLIFSQSPFMFTNLMINRRLDSNNIEQNEKSSTKTKIKNIRVSPL
ncbi:hypothetical protein ISN45_Aa05g012840 [Arabidopsis thaliana x Arabidopsis arenosa]|uniref:Uncharacterized protein n=1 Tax=Arabidopsis thaliana x Arabidopsis arenosa TaxID=1240361 RepID=A0A8T1ZJQ9_9BRAS|nr:hypothetical protein ISN45_Aa05g012840 [Arabidopsis thaliana x Arabidopsis arenosa]